MPTMDVSKLTVIYKILCARYRCLIIAMNAYNGHYLDYKGISFRFCRSHFASSPTLSKVITSDSIVEHAMQVCLEDFQDMTAPLRVKMYPLVDFDFSKPAIQVTSLYLSSTCGYFSYLKAYSLIFFK